MFKLLSILALLFFLGYGILSFFMRSFGQNMNKRQNTQQRPNNNAQPTQEKKHFPKEAGEYVSYEEVKEDKKD